jgi:hypothetical protein
MATELIFVDKSKWGEGPWQNEPDKVFWVDEDTKLDCLAIRSTATGAWCGYVGVKKDHWAYEIDYEHIDNKYSLDVHCGLTFSEFCDEENGEFGICHPSDNGEKVWWIGFDCAHCIDISPAMNHLINSFGHKINPRLQSLRNEIGMFNSYKHLCYVKQEIKKLAVQLKQIENDNHKSV